MRVIVLGGGVIGTSTAWYLAQAGHEVRVVERQAEVGQETSFANAGQVSPGYASPWAAPGVPLKALRWMFQKHAPLAIRPQWDWAQYRWMWQLLQNCNAASYARNKARMVRLSEYSRDCLDLLRTETGIDYEGRQQGTLQLFRTESQLAAAAKDIGVLEQFGVPYQLLDTAGLLAYEPALAQLGAGLVGGLRLPNDQTGDCELFTRRLAEQARTAGVEFQHGATVQHLEVSAGALEAVWIDGRRETADAYVLALGSYSPALLAPLGIRLPVYPLKGYSLTVPIIDPARAPVSTILDETYKIAVTRFDDRIRVGGMAELAGFDMTLRPARRATLEQVVSELYPAAGDLGRASFWTGLRPATPDGTPLVGNSGYRRLFLNTGHGTLGWTMACGSGQYLSDLISGRTPAIDGEGLDLRRYG